MAHWHFWRLTLDPGRIEPNIVGLDLFFARNRFSDARAATEALTSDVVAQYPSAKRLPALAEAIKTMPEHPESAFQYAIPEGDWVMWRLVKCSWRCTATLKRTERAVKAAVTKRTGVPFV